MAAAAVRSFKKTCLLQNTSFYQHFLIRRGLKNRLLYKKTKPKSRYRDGKEWTVDHLYWDLYYKENPQILKERAIISTKNAKPAGKKPVGASRLYDTLTTGDKRLAYAAVFFLITGVIAMKITFT